MEEFIRTHDTVPFSVLRVKANQRYVVGGWLDINEDIYERANQTQYATHEEAAEVRDLLNIFAKIELNIYYPLIGNDSPVFYDVSLAQSITATGQEALKHL